MCHRFTRMCCLLTFCEPRVDTKYDMQLQYLLCVFFGTYLRLMYVHKHVTSAFLTLLLFSMLIIHLCDILCIPFTNVEPDLLHFGFSWNKVCLVRSFPSMALFSEFFMHGIMKCSRMSFILIIVLYCCVPLCQTPHTIYSIIIKPSSSYRPIHNSIAFP